MSNIEHINEFDTLNAGRNKINKFAIDPANRAELNSIDAKSVANQANQTSQNAEAIAVNTDDRLDNIIAGEMQDAEVIDARRPFGSEAYATLGERLDSEKAKFSAQLAHTAKQMKQQSFLFGPKPWFIGHRGCSGFAPESSKKAFELAYFSGMAGIETDLRSTADGHIICYHDTTLDTKTDGTGKPEEVTLEYIQSLKLTKANGYDAYPNTGIATLDEYLEVAKKYNLIIFPEIAVQTEAQVYEITDKILARGLENQCVVLVNRWNYSLVKTHAPNLIRCLIPSWGASNTADIDFCVENGIEICGAAFSASLASVPQSFIDYANEKGIYLYGYIINATKDLSRIKDLGIKFIGTDFFGGDN